MSTLGATGILSNAPVSEFIVLIIGLSTIFGIVWNISEKLHKTTRRLENSIAETNTRIDAVANRFRLLALTASNKQNENANRILDLEGFLEATTSYRKREITNNSGADFLRYDNTQEDIF